MKQIKLGEKHVISLNENSLKHIEESREKLLTESKLVNIQDLVNNQDDKWIFNEKSDK